MKKVLNETGLRNIKDLANRYKKAKIYFHQDLDGVTTALAMKNYLENNGIKVVDSEIIQYGDKEFAVKKQDAQGDTMPVLVDFAHGKPMFVVHTDHHDSQTGVEGDTSTSFRPSRSNVATLSDIMSPSDIFPSEDITLISTVDSADFARFGLKPQDIMNFIFKLQKDKGLQQNKMALGLATNKLLLAYKNKPGFLEKLVMNSTPSLLNIFQNINKIAQQEGYASPEEMSLNQQGYVQKQKDSDKVYVDDGIIVQYGGGSMFKPGSYDRYTPFKNNPDADFLVIAWPMGLVQASCNPFKGERELKGVNLGEIAQEVLAKWEPQLKDKIIPLSTIKWISESGKSFDEESVGFTNADLEAFYGDKVRSIDGGEQYMDRLKDIMNTPSNELSDSEWAILDKLGVPAWEMIQANSGGHKCITNISALNYFGRSKRPPLGKKSYGKKEGDTPYVKFVKMIQRRFVELLKEKINESKNITESATDLRSNLPPYVTVKDNDNNPETDELNSGGEITTDTANISVIFFKELKEAIPDIEGVKITGGNDEYHQEKSTLSKHKCGRAIDFTVGNYYEIKDKLNDFLKGFKAANEGFEFLNEYEHDSKNKTGDHIHFSYRECEEQNKPTKKSSTLLKKGSKGPEVKKLQLNLLTLGYKLPKYGADSDFGDETKKALMNFQSDNNKSDNNKLAVDGIYGPKTKQKMQSKLGDKKKRIHLDNNLKLYLD